MIACLAFLGLGPVFGLHAHDGGRNFHAHGGLIELVHGNSSYQNEHTSSVPHGPETLLGYPENQALLIRTISDWQPAQSKPLTAAPVQSGNRRVPGVISAAELPNLRDFHLLFLGNCASARSPPT